MTDTDSKIDNMKSGKLYDATDSDLLKLRNTAKDLCHDYNLTRPTDTEKKSHIIRKLLGGTGENFEIVAPFWYDYGFNIKIGENFFANHNTVILDAAEVEFGNNVFIGPDCGFHTAAHPIDSTRRDEGLEYALPIKVGNSVWFGAGVHVLAGVTIGDNAVIGAGSVVTGDIPKGSVAAGNPARVIRKVTEEDFRRQY